MNRFKSLFLPIIRYGLCPLLTVLWLCFIFGNSLQSGTESSEQSGKVHTIVNEVAQSVGIEKPISEKTVRNSAHFIEFAALSLLICADLLCFGILTRNGRKRSLLLALLSIPICTLLAMIDETIQRFSAGRSCQWSDVLLDTAGAALAVLCFLGVYLAVCKLRKCLSAKKAIPSK
ncbi:MAG: VanZ family protein [Ruminococcaceae bacterium]|nr:VanZ family protein [Oscillospiraceae bacterium]